MSDESKNKIVLKDTTVGGKVTGRDDYSDNSVDNSVTFNNTNERSAYIEDLYEKFQKEIASDAQLKEICKELNYFSSQIEGDEMQGLEPKLNAASKNPEFIRYAKYSKEKFHKKLISTSQYSLAAQDINVCILSKIHRTFMMEIYTLICSGESEGKIQALITERIINPVKSELGINLFKYDEDDIMGMIFFLTGNCHLKWTA